MWVAKSEKLIGTYITLILDNTGMIWKKYFSTSECYNLVFLIDHASFIDSDISMWQCFITKINLSDNDSVWKYTCFIQLLHQRFYVYSYIQDRHTKSDIHSHIGVV